MRKRRRTVVRIEKASSIAQRQTMLMADLAMKYVKEEGRSALVLRAWQRAIAAEAKASPKLWEKVLAAGRVALRARIDLIEQGRKHLKEERKR